LPALGARASEPAGRRGRSGAPGRAVGAGRAHRDGPGAHRPAPAAARAGRMMHALALAPIVVPARAPVLMRPRAALPGVAGVAALVCAAGVFLRWRPFVTAGASLALILYAVALVGARSHLASAIVLGVSLTLVLDVFEFTRRFHGAVVTGPALMR